MSDVEKVNILVVDDMPDKLLALQAILDELGQNVVAVQSGREALRHLLDTEFAVILLDVNMPDMDGFETASLIRQRKKSEHTPIIFVTAFSDESHAWQGYSLGAVDYILAPVIPEVLRAKIGVFVDLHRKNQQIQRQAEERVVLAQEQAARAAAEALSRRTTFLAEATSQLVRSLDFETTITTFMRLVAQNTADFAGLCFIIDREPVELCEVLWGAPTSESVDTDRVGFDQLPSALVAGIKQVARSGIPQQMSNVDFTEQAIAGFSHTKATLSILPLVVGGNVIAVLWQGRVNQSNLDVDFSLAEALSARAAIAIDNARLYRKIKDGDRRKDEFLAMLGHELRNPLAAACNAIDCLCVAEDDEQLATEAKEILARQMKQMSRLVDDLLDVSRITQGKVELRKEVVELTAIVRRAVTVTASFVSSRLHQLSVTLPPGPLLILADPTRVEQILANLINNAAKYTEPEGKIVVKVERQIGQLAIHVVDNGIGISDELLPHVFDLFAQGDRSLDRAQGGLGIGLTLVQRLVEMHGGTVSVRSKGPRLGAEFTVRLPEYVPASVGSEAQTDAPAEIYTTSRRVLLVDDNEDLAFTLSTLMRRAGHDVQVASDGPAALDLAAIWHPDVMLIDIGLPGLDGYEVARRVRQTSAWRDVRLIAVTGYGQDVDRERSLQAGFHFHLVKPVAFDELQKVLTACGTQEPTSSTATTTLDQ